MFRYLPRCGKANLCKVPGVSPCVSHDIGCIRRLIVFRCQLHPTWLCPGHTPSPSLLPCPYARSTRRLHSIVVVSATLFPRRPPPPPLASSQRVHERGARPKLHARKDKIITRCLLLFRRCFTSFYFYSVTTGERERRFPLFAESPRVVNSTAATNSLHAERLSRPKRKSHTRTRARTHAHTHVPQFGDSFVSVTDFFF